MVMRHLIFFLTIFSTKKSMPKSTFYFLITGSDFDFGAEKKKKQQQAESETNFVLGFVRDFFAFNQHFKENKEKFILFISLTVAAGLSIFLAMFLWNMYRTNRLDRIAKSLRQPNLSQSTLCSATGNYHTKLQSCAY